MAAKKTAKANETTETKTTTEATTPKAEKPAKVEQNGITRPSTGATLRVWEIADELSAKHQRPATRAEVTEAGQKVDLVIGTIHTQYGRWRKFNGLVTPAEEREAARAKAKAEKEEAKAKEKAAKAEEKAAKAADKEIKKENAKAKAKAKTEEAGEPADE